jgi:hypothetical protein
MGHLHKDACPVAGIVFTATRATVPEVKQYRKSIRDDLMGLAPLDIDYEADAARIMFVLRVIKTLFARPSPLGRPFFVNF